MSNYKIKNALGHFVVVEPVDRSTILRTEETSTVFKVLSVGGSEITDVGDELVGQLIIVTPGSIEKTMMEDKEVWYVHDTSIVAVITE